jgi:hypothetical protein
MPILNIMVGAPHLEYTNLRVMYQQWNGENIQEIRSKHEDNPYTLRIGTPNTDDQLRSDRALFIQSYLSYNPITKNIEKRELIPYRNVDKVYIGDQSVEEKYFEKYTAFVNGPMVVEDLLFLESKQSLLQVIQKLTSEIETLRSEVANLKVQTKQQHIYTQ